MSVGAIGGGASMFSMSGGGARSGPGFEDGKPLGCNPPQIGHAEPETTPQPQPGTEPNIELNGAPHFEPRVHLHPTPVIEPRAVFHYDAEASESPVKNRTHASTHHPTAPPNSEIETKPARLATTYDRRARDLIMVGTKPMIDLFV
jgi:hypothetical protein